MDSVISEVFLFEIIHLTKGKRKFRESGKSCSNVKASLLLENNAKEKQKILQDFVFLIDRNTKVFRKSVPFASPSFQKGVELFCPANTGSIKNALEIFLLQVVLAVAKR
ncbi:hypothetical protein D1R32_gp122 [Tunisvirus fontaine2]|uniref:Uncharacterized protein n=1 Tax=Tunisvirus fontaine2 TaxID=1421067 RepID=V9SG25_9VIRU|nr:hypothetical protein D1R32_gp122 [Tunisvirus fontaine2]AHC54839.1 hypothetical protein TNS_ORF121 [Tunisvirus fontaine2]